MATKVNIAIVGDGDSITSFAAAGIDVFDVTGDTVLTTLKKLAKTHKIIFVTDNYSDKCMEFIRKFDSVAYPIFLPVPSKEGSSGAGIESLRTAGEKALGVDILFHS